MATEYKDNPPQFFKPNILNNSSDVQGYYITVNEDDGRTNIFRKSANGSIVNIGSISKSGTTFTNTSEANNAEVQYYTANKSKTITEQAIPVVRRGIGGDSGGGNGKINEILGTQLSTTPSESVSNTTVGTASTSIRDFVSVGAAKIKETLTSTNVSYPRKMRGDQDRIKFTLKEIVGRNFAPSDAPNFTFGSKNLVNLGGSVTLPIQPSISDSNGVEWGGSTLNPIQAYAARQSLSIAQSEDITNRAVEIFTKEAPQAFKKDLGAYSAAINLYLAQEAVGAQGLLSRATGAIVNPNLELLFNGPTLRSFNFTFKLSPRGPEEAEDVKKILFFFKAAMAVRRSTTEVFLKAPYVFNIQYFSGTSEHKSLNKIKECALLGCDVDYTPDGSYMTFNDPNKTMTSYQMTLRFSELDPLYNTDYEDHPIGY